MVAVRELVEAPPGSIRRDVPTLHFRLASRQSSTRRRIDQWIRYCRDWFGIFSRTCTDFATNETGSPAAPESCSSGPKANIGERSSRCPDSPQTRKLGKSMTVAMPGSSFRKNSALRRWPRSDMAMVGKGLRNRDPQKARVKRVGADASGRRKPGQ